MRHAAHRARDDRGDAPLQRFTFAYDPVGNRATVVDSNGSTTTYLYDAKSRLLQDVTVGTNAHVYTYAYDAADDRTFSSETGAGVGYGYDAAGRLSASTDGASYGYDANGNLVTVVGVSPLVTMQYDAENRLVAHWAGRVLTTYAYNGDGQKRQESGRERTTILVWDGDDVLQGRS